jgi:hypothetical protein
MLMEFFSHGSVLSFACGSAELPAIAGEALRMSPFA